MKRILHTCIFKDTTYDIQYCQNGTMADIGTLQQRSSIRLVSGNTSIRMLQQQKIFSLQRLSRRLQVHWYFFNEIDIFFYTLIDDKMIDSTIIQSQNNHIILGHCKVRTGSSIDDIDISAEHNVSMNTKIIERCFIQRILAR